MPIKNPSYKHPLRAVFSPLLLCLALSACGADGGPYARDNDIRLNEIQNLGTHNSFHPYPVDEPLDSIIRKRYKWFVGYGEYRHAPLTEQLERLGVRHLELDVFADHKGGNFSRIPILASVGKSPERNIPDLDTPGFKVLHLPQIDPHSTCWTLVQCLTEIRTWSDSNPGHMPLMVMIEVKDVDFLGLASYIPIRPFTEDDFAALDGEIRSVFPADRLITPDDIQGDYATLEQAVLENGWPTLAQSRGKILFVQYHGRMRKSTAGHVMFPTPKPGNDYAAVIIVEDIIADFDKVQRWVEQGYLVRTRSDVDLKEARNSDYSRLEAALASGAHFISTDVPEPNPMINPKFEIRIPDGTPGRCNPITAPDWCKPGDIENPRYLKAR